MCCFRTGITLTVDNFDSPKLKSVTLRHSYIAYFCQEDILALHEVITENTKKVSDSWIYRHAAVPQVYKQEHQFNILQLCHFTEAFYFFLCYFLLSFFAITLQHQHVVGSALVTFITALTAATHNTLVRDAYKKCLAQDHQINPSQQNLKHPGKQSDTEEMGVLLSGTCTYMQMTQKYLRAVVPCGAWTGCEMD